MSESVCPDCQEPECVCVALTHEKALTKTEREDYYRELEAELHALEKKDPVVRRAAENYNRTVRKIIE